ncbi:unnamed protein product, partial [Closterium sp. NIES-65]
QVFQDLQQALGVNYSSWTCSLSTLWCDDQGMVISMHLIGGDDFNGSIPDSISALDRLTH